MANPNQNPQTDQTPAATTPPAPAKSAGLSSAELVQIKAFIGAARDDFRKLEMDGLLRKDALRRIDQADEALKLLEKLG